MKDLMYAALMATIVLAPVFAWVTHVVSTIQNEQWFLLIAGAFVFPVGIIHGFGLWVGVF